MTASLMLGFANLQYSRETVPLELIQLSSSIVAASYDNHLMGTWHRSIVAKVSKEKSEAGSHDA